MNKSILLSFAVFLCLIMNLQSQSLYGTGISPESALVRIIYAHTEKDVNIDIGNIKFTSNDFKESSLYHPVSPGMYFFELGTDWIEFIPQSGKYFTLIISEGKCFIFEDIEHTVPAKTQLYFYNLQEEKKAALVVSDSLDLVLEIEPESSKQIAINPLNIEFAIKTDSEELVEIGVLPMKRGGSTTIILLENDEGLKTVILEAEVKTGQ